MFPSEIWKRKRWFSTSSYLLPLKFGFLVVRDRGVTSIYLRPLLPFSISTRLLLFSRLVTDPVSPGPLPVLKEVQVTSLHPFLSWRTIETNSDPLRRGMSWTVKRDLVRPILRSTLTGPFVFSFGWVYLTPSSLILNPFWISVVSNECMFGSVRLISTSVSSRLEWEGIVCIDTTG